MRVLVTGANGHVGSNLVRELGTRGHEVVGLVRDRADLRGLQGLDVDLRKGDVRDAAAVEAAAKGAEVILNLAATYEVGAKDAATVVAPAVDAIRNVITAAKKLGVRRVVHTSSTAAVGASPDPQVVLDESHWNERPIDAYYLAKTQSEREAVRLAEDLDVDLVRINPSGVLGDFDYRCTPSSSFVEELTTGYGLTAVGTISYVDARDVAWVHAEAMTRAERGHRYLCTGADLSLQDLGRLVHDLTGRRVGHVPLPRAISLSYIWCQEQVFGLLGKKWSVHYSNSAEVIGRYSQYDNTKAKETFGYAPRGIEVMVKEALRWAAFLGRVDPTGFGFDVTPDPSWVR